MLAVSLTASASWTIRQKKKSETIDRYIIIVELETLTVPNVDAEEMELSSESEQSTEETVEVESEPPEVVLFSLQDELDSERVQCNRDRRGRTNHCPASGTNSGLSEL